MPLMDIALQIDLIAPIVVIILGLMGVVWKLLNDKIKSQEIRIDRMEAKVDQTTLRIEDKLDKVLSKLTDLAVDQANAKSTYVHRDECTNCKH